MWDQQNNEQYQVLDKTSRGQILEKLEDDKKGIKMLNNMCVPITMS